MGYWHSSKHGCRDIFKLGKPRSNYQTHAGDEETQRNPFRQHGEPHRGPHDLPSLKLRRALARGKEVGVRHSERVVLCGTASLT